ncbi:MAG: hypothetical protein JRG95_17845, partial [Deltaproteobacteria bacterium]|nr:hypothetical protein [Deltaproteobacteria bacterium]
MRNWIRLALGLVISAVVLAAAWFATGPPAPEDTLRVLVARKILTMDPNRPDATAVAIAAGRIV